MLNHLDELESEAIYIIREVYAQFENPGILFSGGKDSIVMSHLAKKAFFPAGSRSICNAHKSICSSTREQVDSC